VSEMRKLRVLTCAYACVLEEGSPVAGGEAVLGWNMVQQIGRFHQVWVLTSASNQPGIEAALQRRPAPNLTFVYIELPRWLRPFLTFLGGIQFYAYLWQVKAYWVARKLHPKVRFDAFHHLTYANDWMASYIGALLPIPYVRGPGGGAHRTPKAFLGEYSFRARFWEAFRSFGQWVLRHDPVFLRGQSRARVLLLCNREAADAVPSRHKTKVQWFPVNGISTEDLRIFNGGGAEDISARNRVEMPQGVFHVLSAGKLLSLKGYSLAIRAFAPFAQGHSGFGSGEAGPLEEVDAPPGTAGVDAPMRHFRISQPSRRRRRRCGRGHGSREARHLHGPRRARHARDGGLWYQDSSSVAGGGDWTDDRGVGTALPVSPTQR